MNYKIAFFFIFLSVFLLSGFSVFAQTPNPIEILNPFTDLNPLAATNVLELIEILTNILFWLITVFSMFFIVLGGFLITTAAGNVDQVARGRSYIIYAIIAIILAFLAQAVAPFVRQVLTTSIGGGGGGGGPSPPPPSITCSTVMIQSSCEALGCIWCPTGGPTGSGFCIDSSQACSAGPAPPPMMPCDFVIGNGCVCQGEGRCVGGSDILEICDDWGNGCLEWGGGQDCTVGGQVCYGNECDATCQTPPSPPPMPPPMDATCSWMMVQDACESFGCIWCPTGGPGGLGFCIDSSQTCP